MKLKRFLEDAENVTGAVHVITPGLPDSGDNAQHFQPIDRPQGWERWAEGAVRGLGVTA